MFSCDRHHTWCLSNRRHVEHRAQHGRLPGARAGGHRGQGGHGVRRNPWLLLLRHGAVAAAPAAAAPAAAPATASPAVAAARGCFCCDMGQRPGCRRRRAAAAAAGQPPNQPAGQAGGCPRRAAARAAPPAAVARNTLTRHPARAALSPPLPADVRLAVGHVCAWPGGPGDGPLHPAHRARLARGRCACFLCSAAGVAVGAGGPAARTRLARGRCAPARPATADAGQPCAES